MMKKLILIAFLLLSFGSLSAQIDTVITRDVIAPMGNYNSTAGIEMVYTIGQLVISSTRSINGQFILRQGFHQQDTVQIPVTNTEGLIEFAVQYKIFPNPTEDNLNIVLDSEKLLKLKLQLFDMAGKATNIPVEDVILNGTKTIRWDLTDLPAGVYNLKFMDKQRRDIKTFRIQKIH
ncbi:MAG: T9SS type A sorting domain-containing protein [Bacteroidota bacterium]